MGMMKINGIDMQVEDLEIIETLKEPYCEYVVEDVNGKKYKVKCRATCLWVKKLPVKNPDGSDAYGVGTAAIQTAVTEMREKPADALTQ